MAEPRGHVLVVEDRDALRRMMCHALESDGWRVTAAASAEDGFECLAERAGFDLVLTDLKLPGASGIEMVRASRRAASHVPVVVLTAFGTVATAVEAMKLGASDFLEKPVDIDDLLALADELTGSSETAPTVFHPEGGPMIVGGHPRLRTALRLLEKVAPTDSTVLLTGESGTGKELFARALHALSHRRPEPFVAVNCAAIPEALIENELFGHEKGAYTGAGARQKGRFERAQRGTIFLDEIGELPTAVQGKVLRVLEERLFERVGGGAPVRADVRVVAATNRDLTTMVDQGTFRGDLYYRLEVFPIELPPLRDRPTDVPALASHLIQRVAERLKRTPPTLSDDAEAWLTTQPWPGNIRQLGNVLERAVILAEGSRIEQDDLAPLLTIQESAPAPPSATTADPEAERERETVRAALLATGGDKDRAATALGISRRTLQRRIRAHDLEGFPHYRR
ncbi:MAG: sigma-54 dependent transcriptional regulator [Acidobacteriota bacterium]